MKYSELISTIIKFSINGELINTKDSILFENIKPSDLGMSGNLTRRILNNICSGTNISYMEVGLASGSTFSSAIFENGKETNSFLGFDTFTGTNNKVENIETRNEIKEKFYNNLEKFDTIKKSKVKIIEDNFFNVNLKELFEKEGLNKINVYFYDADHTQNSTYHSIIHAYDVLEDIFLYIVDDWNDSNVRTGCFKSISEAGLNIHYYHPLHCDAGDTLYKDIKEKTLKYEDIDPISDFGNYKTFYNGIGVFVLSKNPISLFEIVKSKTLYDSSLNKESQESLFSESTYNKNEIKWKVK